MSVSFCLSPSYCYPLDLSVSQWFHFDNSVGSEDVGFARCTHFSYECMRCPVNSEDAPSKSNLARWLGNLIAFTSTEHIDYRKPVLNKTLTQIQWKSHRYFFYLKMFFGSDSAEIRASSKKSAKQRFPKLECMSCDFEWMIDGKSVFYWFILPLPLRHHCPSLCNFYEWRFSENGGRSVCTTSIPQTSSLFPIRNVEWIMQFQLGELYHWLMHNSWNGLWHGR